MKKTLSALIFLTSIGFSGTVPQYQPGQVRNSESQFYQPPQQQFNQHQYNQQSTWQQPQQQQWARPREKGVTPQYRPNQIKNTESQFNNQSQNRSVNPQPTYVRPDTGKQLDPNKYTIRELKNNPNYDAVAIPKGEKIQPSPLTESKIMPQRGR